MSSQVIVPIASDVGCIAREISRTGPRQTGSISTGLSSDRKVTVKDFERLSFSLSLSLSLSLCWRFLGDSLPPIGSSTSSVYCSCLSLVMPQKRKCHLECFPSEGLLSTLSSHSSPVLFLHFYFSFCFFLWLFYNYCRRRCCYSSSHYCVHNSHILSMNQTESIDTIQCSSQIVKQSIKFSRMQ